MAVLAENEQTIMYYGLFKKDLETLLHSPYFTIYVYLRNESRFDDCTLDHLCQGRSSPEFSKKQGGLIGKY